MKYNHLMGVGLILWESAWSVNRVILAPAKEHLSKAVVDLYPRTEAFW
jgi:hypothetical protein